MQISIQINTLLHREVCMNAININRCFQPALMAQVSSWKELFLFINARLLVQQMSLFRTEIQWDVFF